MVLTLPAHSQSPKLEIINPSFSQMEDGTPIRGAIDYTGGERLFFRAQLAGYQPLKDHISLNWSVEAIDDKGVPLAKPGAQSVTAELTPEDKDWKPILRYEFEIPNTAVCSKCEVRVSATDANSKQKAEKRFPFSVHSLAVEPSPTLVIRNFRFLRAEDDTKALNPPAYRPGDNLWARFEIVGFQYGPENRIAVEYGLQVFRPSGKLLYEEPKAASAEESSFYPKRYVPGVLNLRLQGLPPGEYPITVKVKDVIGNQEYEAKFPFRVE
ncbi:MAG: hypothetical protein JNK87_34885 [Bryobacterales bacterium]|nr:hypothetical protein [Bryobacterales bacterium]